MHTTNRLAYPALCAGLALLLGFALLTCGCKPSETPPTPTPQPPAAPAAGAPTDSTTAGNTTDSEAPTVTTTPEPAGSATAEPAGSLVKMRTTKGTIMLELFDKQAPITAGSFLLLVKDGFYDGLTFHRVVPDFVIQGGDPTGTGAGGPGFTIPDEVTPELKHDRGMLSMAKTAMPDTGGSQFFIVTGSPRTVGHLDMKHAVFGKVTEGMEVVDKIVKGDKMESVTVLKESPDAAAAMAKAKAARVKE